MGEHLPRNQKVAGSGPAEDEFALFLSRYTGEPDVICGDHMPVLTHRVCMTRTSHVLIACLLVGGGSAFWGSYVVTGDPNGTSASHIGTLVRSSLDRKIEEGST